ncbi:MAG: pyruvate, phosphate dikinase [Candidatus Lokiarchaeota archaeon]|nr:pyruvate, phosphate dikinase [Candidatus Lokiarchaeota archaeon]
MAEKYVYMFSEGSKELKNTLGGKGANLAEMTKLKIPIPQGFTITCQACLEFFKNPKFLEEITPKVEAALKNLEKLAGKKFNDNEDPLLVSVRSGAPMSMPGMMDTVLNLGLTEKNLEALVKKTGNERFALDAYRRFIQMFGDVVMGIDHDDFEHILQEVKSKIGSNAKDTDLTIPHLREIIQKYKILYKEKIGEDFPDNPKEQLYKSIRAVFDSWNSPRAVYYRKFNRIPNFGTAVNIQQMVFGNMGNTSLTGVAFTRDPATGEKQFMGEYLTNAQGEDVVAGIRTPKKLSDMEEEFPATYTELTTLMEKLENHYKDMQDIEFTVQEGNLYLLQTRNGKRTPVAMVKIAIDMMKEELITKEEAILRVDADKLTGLLFKRIDEKSTYELLTKGINASPGAVSGQIVFEPEDAETWSNQGKKVILVRPETKPDDIHGLMASEGVLTVHGGKTSHAAVVARGMGKPAVCGASDLFIDVKKKLFRVNNQVFKEGDVITIDGSTGLVVKGAAPLLEPEISGEFDELLAMADEIRKLGVYANSETIPDTKNAIKFGAEGIGLARTEHMFMAPERLPVVREMIIAKSTDERKKALEKIKPMQKEDFKGIFRIMAGKPVIIRLLDPPLHEFLPDYTSITTEVSLLRYRVKNGEDVKAELEEKEKMLELVSGLHESNPMLGLRGCRLGLKWPEINDMQVEAIFEAAVELKKEGVEVYPEVMIPLIGFISELKPVKEGLKKIADRIIRESGVELHYMFGTMIEIPRAALTADEIAQEAEFFSFGTNDLTQMTLGFSRDDAEGKFIPFYLEKGILEENPFASLDQIGVGKLMKMGVKEGRNTRPDLEIGICGEHGGDPASVEFCHKIGLNYVSCSPFRIPVARLSAAQAQILFPRE